MQHTSVDQARLAASLRDEIGSLCPSEAARRIARFCLADAQTALTTTTFHGVAGAPIRISAAAEVVQGLSYREGSEFREAALDEVRKRLPDVFADRSAAQIILETLKVFDPPTGSCLLSELRDDVACVMVKTLANDGVTPTPIKMKVGLDLLVSPTFGAAFAWKEEVELFARNVMDFLRDANRDVLRVMAPPLISHRRALRCFMPNSGQVFDDVFTAESRTWRPSTPEEVYELLGIECALVGESVLTRGSEPARTLCGLLESTIERWKSESTGAPDSALQLAREVAPLCGHIAVLFSVFPELRGARFETFIAAERKTFMDLAYKAIEAGCACWSFFGLCGSLQLPLSVPVQDLSAGFQRFLNESSPLEVVLGGGAWWSFVRAVVGDSCRKDGTPVIQSFWGILDSFVKNQELVLVATAQTIIDSINAVRISADAKAAEELGAQLVVYGEVYKAYCQSKAVRDEGLIEEVVLASSDKDDKFEDSSTDSPSAPEPREHGSNPDDGLFSLAPMTAPTLSKLEQVRKALETALGDLSSMSRWAAEQIHLPIAAELLPEGAQCAHVLVGILSHDVSNEPLEARWAYAMQTLRLLAAPEVQRLAQYGGVHHSTMIQAMREVLAQQRGLDAVADVLSNFES